MLETYNMNIRASYICCTKYLSFCVIEKGNKRCDISIPNPHKKMLLCKSGKAQSLVKSTALYPDCQIMCVSPIPLTQLPQERKEIHSLIWSNYILHCVFAFSLSLSFLFLKGQAINAYSLTHVGN